jgi:hypothetical protein
MADLGTVVYGRGAPGTMGSDGLLNNYSTSFTTIETVLTEGGVWKTGLRDGLDWTDPRVDANGVRSTQSGSPPPPYNDSVAVLIGTFGATQDASATVRTTNQQGGSVFEEFEILLRWSISANVSRGYEVLFSVSKLYCEIVRWNGALNNFTSLAQNSNLPVLTTGDIVRGTISGSTITAYHNGSQILQTTDSTWATGNPGIGIYFNTDGSGGAVTDYSMTYYEVTTS